MPVMGGLEATAILRNMKEYKETPILGLTAVSDKEPCLRAGMNCVLRVPFKGEELMKAFSVCKRK